MSRRVAGILSMCLLVASLSAVGTGSALAAAATPDVAVPAASATIGVGSCLSGTDPCGGATGNIGANSCNGDFSCAATTGNIGDNACDGIQACDEATHDIGASSCNGFGACDEATHDIGASSCNGFDACLEAASAIGFNSCNGSLSCAEVTGTIGNNSCNNAEFLCRSASSDIGNCMYNDFIPAACVQPDAKIRLVGRPHTHGNDIYNTDGTNETLTPKRSAGRKLRIVISIQNDGALADSFTLGTSMVVSSTGVTSATVAEPTLTFYHGWPRRDISAAVIAGTFATPVLAPGATYQIVAQVTPPVGATFVATAAGITVHYLVTATSVGNSAQQDAVGLVVGVRATH